MVVEFLNLNLFLVELNFVLVVVFLNFGLVEVVEELNSGVGWLKEGVVEDVFVLNKFLDGFFCLNVVFVVGVLFVLVNSLLSIDGFVFVEFWLNFFDLVCLNSFVFVFVEDEEIWLNIFVFVVDIEEDVDVLNNFFLDVEVVFDCLNNLVLEVEDIVFVCLNNLEVVVVGCLNNSVLEFVVGCLKSLDLVVVVCLFKFLDLVVVVCCLNKDVVMVDVVEDCLNVLLFEVKGFLSKLVFVLE